MVPPRIGNFSILFSFLSTPPPRLPTSFPAGSKALLAGETEGKKEGKKESKNEETQKGTKGQKRI